MRKPVVITTPMPTPAEVAKLLGIPKKDQKRIRALVDEIVSRPEFVDAFPPRHGEPQNGKQDKPGRRKSRENGDP